MRFKRWRLGGAITFVCFSTVVAHGQYFPSDDLTNAFERTVRTVAKNHGGAFLSACRDLENNGVAILLMPVGSRSGTLALAVKGKVYNGAGVEVRRGRVSITEGGGGEWSYRRLQFFAEKLAGMAFQLRSGQQLANLLQTRPQHSCPAFKDELG